MPTSKWLENVNLEQDFPELKTYFGENYQKYLKEYEHNNTFV